MKIEDRFLCRGKVINVSFSRTLPPFSMEGKRISVAEVESRKTIEKTDVWVDGYASPPCGYEGITIVSRCGWKRHEIDPETLSQCTGLKDKNGKLIFEGDIVRYWHEDYEEEEDISFIERSGVCGFWVYDQPPEEFNILTDPGYAFEVIGNRWDNPELLGGVDD